MDKYIVSIVRYYIHISKLFDFKIDESVGLDTFAERIIVRKKDSNQTYILSKVCF